MNLREPIPLRDPVPPTEPPKDYVENSPPIPQDEDAPGCIDEVPAAVALVLLYAGVLYGIAEWTLSSLGVSR